VIALSELMTKSEMVQEIDRLRKLRQAVILAHNYQVPEVQDVADYVGDSLGLSREAARTDAPVIVFAGVHFMAETAAILNPRKLVLSPDPTAGCSLAESISAEQLRAWKAEHPGAVVVSYVNTSAEVKAESDYCCTSGNAEKVIRAIPEEREILFLPDMFLGAYLQKVTGRRNMQLWAGECHVHAGISAEDVNAAAAAHPGAELLVHPECGCASASMYNAARGALRVPLQVLSTEKMVDLAKAAPAGSEFLVATETGILHRLEREASGRAFFPVNRAAVCRYMKQITLEKLYRSLRDEVYPIVVPPEIADRARLAIQRMVAIG
jgi:quinolinate synthase